MQVTILLIFTTKMGNPSPDLTQTKIGNLQEWVHGLRICSERKSRVYMSV